MNIPGRNRKLNLANPDVAERAEGMGGEAPHDRLPLIAACWTKKGDCRSLLEFSFTLPAVLTTWVAFKCLNSLELLNRIGWFYVLGMHAATMACLWYGAIKLVRIDHDKESQRRVFIMGYILGLLYFFSSILSWIMVVFAMMFLIV
ncbi:MAG: hypothetical protein JNL58_30570 [Planctomyces sp.]|nr:hypothetical protein [Planctomyces sp.]